MILPIFFLFLAFLTFSCGFRLSGGCSTNFQAHQRTLLERRLVTPTHQTTALKHRRDILKRDMFLAPQIAFAASCAGAVFAYVYFNIDEIKEKQRIATDRVKVEQTVNIRTAQDAQRDAIEKAQRDQAENIRKIQDDARRRAEAFESNKRK